MEYKFQSKFTEELNVPESLKLQRENEYAQKLWASGNDEDKAKAMDILEHLSKEFLDGRAKNNLAWIYESGEFVRRNHKRAMHLYHSAAYAGDPLAMSNLADKYLFSNPECMDILDGFTMAYVAASMGEKNAKLTLAYCYIKGLVALQDFDYAKYLLESAGLKYGELPKFGMKFGVTPCPQKIRSLRMAILEMKERIEESPFIMEPVKETVWVSPGLEFYPEVFKNLKDALESRDIPFRLLPGEKNRKHVWARDYMPVQIGRDRFVIQTYAPDYLEDDPSYIPDYRKIVSEVKPGHIIGTKRIFDGGNVLIEGHTAIMTDKVLYENSGDNSAELVHELCHLLGVDRIYIIPWDMNEPYGHADGMVRFVSEDTVVISNFSNLGGILGHRLRRFLENNGFTVRELHFEGKLTNRFNWGYINFLKVGDRLFVPQFGIQEDTQALDQLGRIYSGCEIIPIFGCEMLAKDGGVLNCVTWTVKE